MQLHHREILNKHMYMLQNPPLELSKYQTLPGKRSRKSELRPELNGEGGGEYLSPVQLSPVHSRDQDYSLSESTIQLLFSFFFLKIIQTKLQRGRAHTAADGELDASTSTPMQINTLV